MVFERKKKPLSLPVWSYNLHPMYFKYETANLAWKKIIVKDLIVVAL